MLLFSSFSQFFCASHRFNKQRKTSTNPSQSVSRYLRHANQVNMTSSPKTSTSSMGGFKKLKIFNFRKRNRAQSLPETVMATQFASLGATADAKARAHRNSDASQPPVPRTHRNSDVTQPHMARRHRNSDVTQPVFPRRHRNSDITRPQGLFPMFPVSSAYRGSAAGARNFCPLCGRPLHEVSKAQDNWWSLIDSHKQDACLEV